MAIIKWNCLAGLLKRTIQFMRISANYLTVQHVKNGTYGLTETSQLCPHMRMDKGPPPAEG